VAQEISDRFEGPGPGLGDDHLDPAVFPGRRQRRHGGRLDGPILGVPAARQTIEVLLADGPLELEVIGHRHGLPAARHHVRELSVRGQENHALRRKIEGAHHGQTRLLRRQIASQRGPLSLVLEVGQAGAWLQHQPVDRLLRRHATTGDLDAIPFRDLVACLGHDLAVHGDDAALDELFGLAARSHG